MMSPTTAQGVGSCHLPQSKVRIHVTYHSRRWGCMPPTRAEGEDSCHLPEPRVRILFDEWLSLLQADLIQQLSSVSQRLWATRNRNSKNLDSCCTEFTCPYFYMYMYMYIYTYLYTPKLVHHQVNSATKAKKTSCYNRALTLTSISRTFSRLGCSGSATISSRSTDRICRSLNSQM